MPFTKITSGKNKGKYRSPSGRIYSAAQVRLYYHGDGFPKHKRKTKRKK
jgi:hypothetical protein